MSNLWFLYIFFSALLIFIGLYCLLTMRNLIRLFIAVEIISKGVSLAIVATGAVKNNILLAQSLTITYIVVEVALVATALAMIINIYRKNKSLDVRLLSRLKG
ncbi:MAG: NADH-quinone oxidoreductase subunit K [Candidatus Saccharicenans sp.]